MAPGPEKRLPGQSNAEYGVKSGSVVYDDVSVEVLRVRR